MAIFTCRDLSLGYEGKAVIENVSFTVNAGDYLCVVGENGSGKSTLVKGLLGLRAPISGEIVVGDGLKAGEIGYLPQQTPAQRDFPASVQEVVLSGFLNRLGRRLFYSRDERKQALAEMERLGIAHLKNHSYQELSGGQQQRVLLARALCATGKVLLLDEPAAGLDPVVTAQLYELIQLINRERGITVIMVSHDIPAAVRYADHILHLGHEATFFGTTADYTQSPFGKRFLEEGAL